MNDSRDVTLMREAAEDALRDYAVALRVWNAPDDEHTRIQLRSLIEQIIRTALGEAGDE